MTGRLSTRTVSGLRAEPDSGRVAVERAVGLLAGRSRCRLAEAHRHLSRVAAERRCEVAELARRVIRLLDSAEPGPLPETVPLLVAAALVNPAPVLPAAESTSWLATVQGVLDSLPGMTGYLTGEWDSAGRLGDLVWAAVSPSAVAPDGRRGAQLIGSRLCRRGVSQERWAAYQRVLDSGEPADLDGTDFVVRARRLGPGLLISWERAAGSPDAVRLAEVERTLAAEHELAGRLQRIILPIPAEPLELPGLRVALRYLPAAQEAMVGGDWFHAAPLGDGSTLLAVGDVAGHGTHAATVMAQLRHALRALSVVTSDPGTLLEHLNQLTCELGADSPELAATAVIARFDPERGELVWAQAGHPPPLLNRRGHTAPLARPPGPMLGVVENARYADAVTGFGSGDVLLLYTDGLVEHRRRGLDVGLDAVITTVDDAVRVSPGQPLSELLARLQRANPDDDTCILAARPGVA
ncbi:MAG TPA: SpoIIE family protein phosphatase [Actinoplanes sp.]|nr:SpoIIE family protein phosphatase [Actinoplanes sp.]